MKNEKKKLIEKKEVLLKAIDSEDMEIHVLSNFENIIDVNEIYRKNVEYVAETIKKRNNSRKLSLRTVSNDNDKLLMMKLNHQVFFYF